MKVVLVGIEFDSSRQQFAIFDKKEGVCTVSVFRSSMAPVTNKKPVEYRGILEKHRACSGLHYEVTPKAGNDFYKLLVSKGWTKH